MRRTSTPTRYGDVFFCILQFMRVTYRVVRAAWLVALMAGMIFSFTSAYAQQSAGTPTQQNSAACDQLFNLPQGTMTSSVGQTVMNPTVCAAYQYLISIYQPGSSTLACIPNAKVVGITSLNPDFAVRAAKMLQAAQAAVGPFGINSAYRNACAQKSANPAGFAGNPNGSMHTKGLAIDLIYPGGGTKNDCSSAGYKWIIANAKNYGIAQYSQVHSYVSGECNHVENTGTVNGGTGPGASQVPNTPPTSGAPFDSTVRDIVTPPQQMNASACVTSVNPLVVAQPGTVYQSQCLTNAQGQQQPLPPQQPPMAPQQPQLPAQPATAAPVTTATTPTSATQTPPPLGVQNTTPLAAGTCAPQFYCSGTNYYYRNSTCVDQVYQSCPNGCSAGGTTCALPTQSATSGSSILSNLLSTSSAASILNTNSGAGPSVLDLINAYANTPTTPLLTPVSAATPTPVTLNQDTQNLIASLEASSSNVAIGSAVNLNGQPASSSSAPYGTASSTNPQKNLQYLVQPPQPVATQTFGPSDSGNLNPPAAPTTIGSQNAGLLQILALMKQIVLATLTYLKPFGGVASSE